MISAKTSPLESFGVKWTPSQPVDLKTATPADLEEIAAAAADAGLLVMERVRPFPSTGKTIDSKDKPNQFAQSILTQAVSATTQNELAQTETAILQAAYGAGVVHAVIQGELDQALKELKDDWGDIRKQGKYLQKVVEGKSAFDQEMMDETRRLAGKNHFDKQILYLLQNALRAASHTSVDFSKLDRAVVLARQTQANTSFGKGTDVLLECEQKPAAQFTVDFLFRMGQTPWTITTWNEAAQKAKAEFFDERSQGWRY